MAKLYPPVISGTIPAFYGTVLTVPFSMNRAVSATEIKGYSLKIKTVTGRTLLTKEVSTSAITEDGIKFSFSNRDLNSLNLVVGQYYKIQLAYKDQADITGYYSTIGVVKYTAKPKVLIENLKYNDLNSNLYHYVGVYSQEGDDKDSTEKLYSSRFYFYDNLGELIWKTDEILHNVSEDVNSYESKTEFILKDSLNSELTYSLQYEIRTINDLVVKSPRYRIKEMRSIPPEMEVSLIAKRNFEEGYIDLNFEESGVLLTGNIVLSRKSNQDNVWRELKRFSFLSTRSETWHFRDYTVEQGHIYTYAFQQYNKYDFYSSRVLSNDVLCDFEDYFLCDQNHYLKVRFNPKVSTWKTNLLESKMETIGSKYPFFFKNGNTRYKELALSGLMSYQIDDLESFVERYWDKQFRKTTPAEYYGVYVFKGTLYKTRPRIVIIDGERYLLGDLVNDNKLIGGKDAFNSDFKRLLSLIQNPEYITEKDRILGDIDKNGLIQGGSKKLPNNETVWDQDLAALQTLIAKDNASIIAPVIGVTYKDLELNTFFTYDGEKFIPIEEDNTFYRSTNLTSDNIFLERIFKNEVLDWLNDGKPKMFKSATEGEYIVRLMNVTTTPTDQLGRMIHTFNCVAYEMADLNFDNLIYYGIIDTSFEQKKFLKEYTIPFRKYYRNDYDGWVEIFDGTLNCPCYHARFLDILPGTIIKINGIEIGIGSTGAYQYDNVAEPIYSIQIKVNNQEAFQDNNYIFGMGTGSVSLLYESDEVQGFDLYKEIQLSDVPIWQHIGRSFHQCEFHANERESTKLFNKITNIRTSLAEKYFVKFKKRDILDIYIKANKVRNLSNNTEFKDITKYKDIYGKIEFKDIEHETALYRIRQCYNSLESTETSPYRVGEWAEGYYIDAQGNQELAPYTGYCYDPIENKVFVWEDSLFRYQLSYNNENPCLYNINCPEVTVIEKANDISSIEETNAGVITEMSYSEQINIYSVEETDILVKKAKEEFERVKQQFEEGRLNNEKEYKEKYIKFMKALERSIRYYNFINDISYQGQHNNNSFLKQYFDGHGFIPYQMTFEEVVQYEKELNNQEDLEFREKYNTYIQNLKNSGGGNN